MSLKVEDHTQSRWLTAFGDAGDAILGASAPQLQAMGGDGGEPTPALAALISVSLVGRIGWRCAVCLWGDGLPRRSAGRCLVLVLTVACLPPPPLLTC